MILKELFGLLKESFREWKEAGGPRLGAALAFYSVFSLAPLLIIVVSISGLVFGHDAAQGRVVEQLQSLVGKEAAESIQSIIENARKPTASVIAGLIGIAALLLGASGLFAELQGALNTIWRVKSDPKGGVWRLVRNHFVSFTMVFGAGFLLLTSLIISAGLAALTDSLTEITVIPSLLLQVLQFVISFALTTLVFAMIFKRLPDIEIGWQEVWIGAAMTSLLFTIGKSLIGWYLGRSGVASSYGAAGSLVIVLLWVYYSAQILLFGAEFTQVYSRRRSLRLEHDEERAYKVASSQ